MITVKILSDKNVKVTCYANADGTMDFWLTYTCATQKPYGMHQSEYAGMMYTVSPHQRCRKKDNTPIYVNYAKYMTSIRMPVESFGKLQRELNQEYFKFKKYSMIDARKAKIEKLESVNPVRHSRKIENLKKEISILQDVPDGEMFGAYIVSRKYREERERIKLEGLPF